MQFRKRFHQSEMVTGEPSRLPRYLRSTGVDKLPSVENAGQKPPLLWIPTEGGYPRVPGYLGMETTSTTNLLYPPALALGKGWRLRSPSAMWILPSSILILEALQVQKSASCLPDSRWPTRWLESRPATASWTTDCSSRRMFAPTHAHLSDCV